MNVTTHKEYVLLSKKGMHELRHAIQQLEHDRKHALRRLKEADKGTAHEARLERNERLAHLEAVEEELAEKRRTLDHAQLMPSRRTRMKVALGSVVDLIDQQGRLFRYTLVDSIEANPSDGRISIESPLGSTLIGKVEKDMVEWGNGKRHNSLRLVRIS